MKDRYYLRVHNGRTGTWVPFDKLSSMNICVNALRKYGAWHARMAIDRKTGDLIPLLGDSEEEEGR